MLRIVTALSLFFPSIATAVVLKNPIPKINSFNDFITEIINIIVIVATPVVMLAILYSGFLFVTARGNVDKLDEAKAMFTWSVVGGAIILGAKVIATAISGTFPLQ